MVVYRRTNTKNGKVYIGKTTRTAEARWVSLLYEINRGNHAPIHNAIRKYGAEAFETDILYKARTYEELSKMETFFIIIHQSHKPENGYNLTLGGDGAAPGELNHMWGKTHTDEVRAAQRERKLGTKQAEETKRKIGEACSGEKNGFYGCKHSEQTCQLLSEKLSGENHPLFGKKRPPEFGQTISRALTGVVRSKETRKRISRAKKGQGLGRKHSLESIERMRAARSLYWARRKGGERINPSLSTF
jgi:group I intron endonuclease